MVVRLIVELGYCKAVKGRDIGWVGEMRQSARALMLQFGCCGQSSLFVSHGQLYRLRSPESEV